jgi:hypothetical protein
MNQISNYAHSPATERQAYEVSAYRKRKSKLLSLRDTKCRGNPEYFFQFLFISLSLKGLATIFLEQTRKRQRTCHAVVSSLRDILVFLILLGHLLGPIKALLLWARALRDSLLFTTTSNKSSRFILAKSKNLRDTMRGFKD